MDMVNAFENRDMKASLEVVKMVPELCASILTSDLVQKIDINTFHVVFFSVFGNECLFTLMEDSKVSYV